MRVWCGDNTCLFEIVSLSSRAMSDYVDTMNFLSRISANLRLLVISFPCLQFEFTNHEVWRIFQKAYTQIYPCSIVEQIKHWLHVYIASVGGQRACIRLIFPQGVCASVPRPRVKYVLFQRVPLNLVYMVHTILQEYAVDLSLQYQCFRIGSSEILRMLGCIWVSILRLSGLWLSHSGVLWMSRYGRDALTSSC